MSKYPEKYVAYRRRVSKFDPFKTPVKGLFLNLLGEKEKVDALVYGQLVEEEEVPSLIDGVDDDKKQQ